VTIVYVDSSALLKRVLSEPQSRAVADALQAHAARRDLLTSSSLAWVEVARALRRADEVVPGLDLGVASAGALSGIAELPLDDVILASARTVGGHLLRILDAIHLASALSAGADTVMTYDDRLAAAAVAEGLEVASPA
jgi:predicted nucleic acid-binding protein